MAKSSKVHVLHPPKHHDDDDGHGGGHDDGHGGGGHCPPPWILTFADMVTLLMAFFVMLLMTSKPDTPKFNAFASTMRQTFGSELNKGGATVLDLNIGPQSGEPSDDPSTSSPEAGGAEESSGEPMEEAGKQIAQAMRDAMANGELTVESDAGTVTVRLPSGSGKEDAQALAEALSSAMGAEATGPAPGAKAPQAGGAGEDKAQSAGEGAGGPKTGEAEGEGGNGGWSEVQAKIAAARMGLMLDEQARDGTVEVEQRDGKVIVTVGAGGGFVSGSADMTDEARRIVEDVAKAAGPTAARIVVTGHTDNVPLSGSRFTDNWDLAAARAANVVRELGTAPQLADTELVAVSRGEDDPVADNATEEGRAKNRRIEIEVEYAD